MMGWMQSLKSKNEIDHVFRKGISLRSDFLFAKILPNNGKFCRIAISVGLKFSKKAVDRNRLKRLLRESARENEVTLKKATDIVFFVKAPSPQEISFENINKHVSAIFKKLS